MSVYKLFISCFHLLCVSVELFRAAGQTDCAHTQRKQQGSGRGARPCQGEWMVLSTTHPSAGGLAGVRLHGRGGIRGVHPAPAFAVETHLIWGIL